MMDEGDVLLSADSLEKSFGGLKAVQAVSVQIRAGQILGLIGPNGAGKSTLVNLIGGNLRPDAGSVSLLGIDVTTARPHARAKLGLVRTFQANRTFPLLNGTDVIMIGLSSKAKDSLLRWLVTPWSALRERRNLITRAKQLLVDLELDEALAPTPVELLAPAVNRMLSFGIAIAGEPRVLVLDEPCASLSSIERGRLSELIRDIAGTGVGVLVIEHDVGFIMRTCDRVLAVDHGVAIAEGSPDEVRSDPEVQRAYFGDSDAVS